MWKRKNYINHSRWCSYSVKKLWGVGTTRCNSHSDSWTEQRQWEIAWGGGGGLQPFRPSVRGADLLFSLWVISPSERDASENVYTQSIETHSDMLIRFENSETTIPRRPRPRLLPYFSLPRWRSSCNFHRAAQLREIIRRPSPCRPHVRPTCLSHDTSASAPRSRDHLKNKKKKKKKEERNDEMRTRNRDSGKSFQPRRRSGVADYRRRMFPLNNETCAVREELSHYVETVTMYLSLSFLFPSQQCQDNDAISKPLILEGGRLLILRNHYFVTCRNSYYTSITCFHFYIINFSPVFLFFFCFQLRENTKDTYF